MTKANDEHPHSGDSECMICGHDIDIDLPSTLIDSAHHGDVVLFVGAGVSTEVPAVFPETFYEQVKSELPTVEADEDFPTVMQRYQDAFGRARLVRKLWRRFDYADAFPSVGLPAHRFHEELATMPYLQKIVTTNWDTYFEDYAGAIPFVQDTDFIFDELPGRHIYKIHGSMTSPSSLIITQRDYERRLTELRDNLLGAELRKVLSTKTVVFVGYSLNDWHFREIFEAVTGSMADFAPQAFIVDPFENSVAKELGVRQLQTSGISFLRALKAELVKDHFLADDAYDRVARLRRRASNAHLAAAELSVTEYPAAVYCLSFQDGLLDACNRILTRRSTGEYSNGHAVAELLRRYEKYEDDSWDEKRFWDTSYIAGYSAGLISLLMTDRQAKRIPVFFCFGSNKTIKTISDLTKALKSRRVQRGKPWKQAKKLARNSGGLVPQHTAFLPGLQSENW